MQKRIIQAGLAGMNQDVINPKVNTQYAYEIKNFRINSTGHSNGIELTSEKGTYLVPIKYNNQYIDDVITISVNNEPADRELELEHYYEVIGHCVLNQYLTLFIYGWYLTRGENDTIVTNPNDCIVRLEFNDDETEFNAVLLYHGNLGFDNNHKIECVPYMESTDIQKVYWIDGINYPRVINIVREGGYTDFDEDEDPFSFYQLISSGSYNTIDVRKTYVGGLFYAGVIQYAFSFYNKNALETPIIYTTPLNYISHSDMGEVANKQLGCAFDVTVKINIEDGNNFEYVRVYSIYRSSINGTPVVKVIKDCRCDSLSQIGVLPSGYLRLKFVDTNEQGYDFDAYRILINSDHIIPNAIGYKDLKMFLGNYSSDTNIKEYNHYEDRGSIYWDSDVAVKVKDGNNDIYDYSNQLKNDSNAIKTFKHGESYKFGFLLQDHYGRWGLVYYYNTSKNNIYPQIVGNNSVLPYAESSVGLSDILDADDFVNYKSIRPVISFPTISERIILCQGIVNPTVFNLGQRRNNTCFALSSWFFRPFSDNVDEDYASGLYYNHRVAFVEYRDSHPLNNSLKMNSELLNMYFDDDPYNGSKTRKYIHDNRYLTLASFVGTAGQTTPPPFGITGLQKLASPVSFIYMGVTYSYDYAIVSDGYIQKVFNIKQENEYDTYPASSTKVYEYVLESFTYYPYEDSLNELFPYPTTSQTALYRAQYPDASYFWSNKSTEYVYALTQDSIRPYIDDYKDIDEGNHSYDSFYFVDQSTLTLNSPDIEFDTNVSNVDLSQYKIRIIGKVNFKNIASKYSVVSESPLFLNNGTVDSNGERPIRSSTLAYGFYDKSIKYKLDFAGYRVLHGRMLSSIPWWVDDICNIFTWHDDVYCPWNQNDELKLYMIYPWQRQYLNNYNGNKFTSFGNSSSGDNRFGITEESASSKIIRKILSNLRFCDTEYLNDGNEETIESSFIKLYNSSENQMIKIGDQKFYYGNVDQLITCTSNYKGSGFEYGNGAGSTDVHWIETDKTGYPIVIGNRMYTTKTERWPSYNDIESISDGRDMRTMNASNEALGYKDYTLSDHTQDPILMRYKSAPHILFDSNIPFDTNVELLKDGFLYLCEIYKDVESTPYEEDNSLSVLLSRTWVPCGESLPLQGNQYVGQLKLRWTEGDTYFQRYDCLKTYPYSNEDYLSVVEIASFMVETHINLDGRYDENRGLIDNTFVNPTNFNLINPVYSQTNNFFQYNVLDEEDFKTTDFPTRFTWSLNKINGLDIDEWTRTNTAAFYDCDGDKGEITSLRRFNNQIYAFQDKGISRIKYNENVAINTNNGTPIELGNSLAVNGVEYLSELVGSQNKWSNISTPNGIFFTDNYTAGLYRLGGGERVLTNLTKNTLQRWFESNNANHDFINTASYDANMNEIHFMFGNESLAYNNDFGTFTSFYDYRGMVGNIKNHSFNITGNSIYFLRESNKYNSFYGTKKPYWISFVANSNIDGYSPSNAIYDNVWYKADVLHSTKTDNFNYDELIQNTDDVIPDFSKDTGWYETFNKIVVGNDYQYAENRNQTKNFDFIKKFRTWRVPVPRQDRARMRNSWLRIRLENTKPSYDKMVLRDIYVDSFF